ncbi:MAG: FAD-dependent oxidoreductase [Oscillatoriophycideae cyanobacterium NC_groundwater_1537_Pr4_S-0.65um_50_18]|nr:FAD-dependent oxidoreductase [Oscillatoriophycideae cyanobacterium NC_groundwater_1537_Pr4_S-0.65um_50_18]
MSQHNLLANRPQKIYIIGAGIAGLLTADAIVELYKQQSGSAFIPSIEVLDQAPQVADKLTRGNGRSMAVTEGLIASGAMREELEAAFRTPVAAGGMVYPGFVPTAADEAAIATYISGAGTALNDTAIATQLQNDALLRFGFANYELWQAFARRNPDIAAKAGLQMDKKFRVYECANARERAQREVAHLNRIGAEFGYDTCGRLLDYQDVLALDPSLQPYFSDRLDEQGQFPGWITLQPGGVVNGKILAEALEKKLVDSGKVTFTYNVKVCGVTWTHGGQLDGLTVFKAGAQVHIGSCSDQFIFTTGGERLLNQAGVMPQETFPIAGATITIPVDEEIVRQEIPFSRKSWKQDGIGPVVISPTFCPSDRYLAFLDVFDPVSFDPAAPEVQVREFFSSQFLAAFDAKTFDPKTIDPRVIESFDPNAMGAKAGRWEIRVGGLKFYPGKTEALDLDHTGARWALAELVRKAMEFMPELMAQVLGHDLTAIVDQQGKRTYQVTAEDIAQLQPWTGGRPMYNHGMAAVGAFCDNGFLLAGTGSWGMACGLGNAAIVAQLVASVPPAQIQLGQMATCWVVDYLERVRPLHQATPALAFTAG